MVNKIQGGRCSAKAPIGFVSILAAAALTCFLSGFGAAEELTLDRIFFSQEDRAVLELLRNASRLPVLSTSEAESKAKSVQEKPQTYTLGGTVTGKSGVRAVWLNDHPYPSAGLPVHVEVVEPYAAGQIVLQVQGSSKSYALRPGQTLYPDGRIRESYEQPPIPAAAASAGTEAVGTPPIALHPEQPSSTVSTPPEKP